MFVEKPRSLKSQVYAQIKDAIINKKIKRDTIYSEQWFADTFQISRTPVREALLQLRSEGMVEVLPNRGVIVKRMTLRDAQHIYQTRTAIEGFCSMYLAMHAEEEEARQTLDRAEALIEACNRDFNRPLEMQFHIEIIKFTGNPEFLSQFDHMRSKMDIFWNEVVTCENRKEEIYAEHMRILNCMRVGDGIGAYRASADHMDITLQKIREGRFFDVEDELQPAEPVT